MMRRRLIYIPGPAALVLGLGLLALSCSTSQKSIEAQERQEALEEPKVLPALDTYGGMVDVPCPGKPTGFFRLAKLGTRWMLCSPQGHAFWMRSVFAANGSDIERDVVASKYGGDLEGWATHRNRRYLAWGFNTIGEYTSNRGVPIGAYGGPGNPVKLPFNIYFSAVFSALRNPSAVGLKEPVKDIVNGVPKSTYNDWRAPLIDVYAPEFAQACAAEVNYWKNVYNGDFASKPWVIGLTVEDADDLWGFKSRGDAPVNAYPHSGFMVATTNFDYTTPSMHGRGPSDPKLHSKYAWIEFLKKRYPTVSDLNKAWKTNDFYTSFDDAGGYGAGTGVIDEDGRHKAWMGSDPYLLKNASPAVRADLDDFLYEFARKFASVAVTALRTVDKNHLIFGPVSLNNYGAKARDQILRGLTDGGIEVFWFNYDPAYGSMAGSMAENNQSYDLTGKPALIWYSVTAQKDSELASRPTIYGQPNFPTQADRGRHAERVDIPSFLNARGRNGDHYVIGYGWWQLVDNFSEGVNWGLITRKDNAYDGREAVVAPSKDTWGFPTGGEATNYGDALSAIRRANLRAAEQLWKELRGEKSPGSQPARGTKER